MVDFVTERVVNLDPRKVVSQVYDDIQYDGMGMIAKYFHKLLDNLFRLGDKQDGRLDMTDRATVQSVKDSLSDAFGKANEQRPDMTVDQFLREFSFVFRDKYCWYGSIGGFDCSSLKDELKSILLPIQLSNISRARSQIELELQHLNSQYEQVRNTPDLLTVLADSNSLIYNANFFKKKVNVLSQALASCDVKVYPGLAQRYAQLLVNLNEAEAKFDPYLKGVESLHTNKWQELDQVFAKVMG